MYPYEANRADELTIQRGDVITVLYIDNENWQMGELADGTQGYFPSNYVTVMEQGRICCCCTRANNRRVRELAPIGDEFIGDVLNGFFFLPKKK